MSDRRVGEYNEDEDSFDLLNRRWRRNPANNRVEPLLHVMAHHAAQEFKGPDNPNLSRRLATDSLLQAQGLRRARGCNA